MPSDFCGYLSDAAERLQVWHAALRERQFGLVRWAGDRVNKGLNAALYVPAQGQSTQLFNDGSALAGLSEMAIGLAWMFGVRLPRNFLYPFKLD